jgi:phosphohistidine phosphatase SixA
MQIVLVRHGRKAKDRPLPDQDLPLSNEGANEVRELGVELIRMGARPGVYLSSAFAHAIETAQVLAKAIAGDPKPRVIPLSALTPGNAYTFGLIVREARAAGISLEEHGSVAIVLHYPRIHQLTAALTSAPLVQEDPGYAIASVVEGDSVAALATGGGATRAVWRRTGSGALVFRDCSKREGLGSES